MVLEIPSFLADGEQRAALLAIAAVAATYAFGVRACWSHAGAGRGIRRAQVWSFAVGIAVLLAAVVSPLDSAADDLFSAHMAQHVLLAVVAPPFLVFGAPLLAAAWTLPAASRRRAAMLIRRTPWLTEIWRLLTALPYAWAIHAVTLWTWHIPSLYTAALVHPAVHALEHTTLLGTGALLWWGIAHPRRARRVAYGTGLAVLFATMMQSGALGALIALSHHLWYPAQAVNAGARGFTAMEDQQLAGLIMWVGGGLLYLAAMSVLFVAWLRAAGRGARGSDGTHGDTRDVIVVAALPPSLTTSEAGTRR